MATSCPAWATPATASSGRSSRHAVGAKLRHGPSGSTLPAFTHLHRPFRLSPRPSERERARAEGDGRTGLLATAGLPERMSVGSGKGVSGRVRLWGRQDIKK